MLENLSESYVHTNTNVRHLSVQINVEKQQGNVVQLPDIRLSWRTKEAKQYLLSLSKIVFSLMPPSHCFILRHVTTSVNLKAMTHQAGQSLAVFEQILHRLWLFGRS